MLRYLISARHVEKIEFHVVAGIRIIVEKQQRGFLVSQGHQIPVIETPDGALMTEKKVAEVV